MKSLHFFLDVDVKSVHNTFHVKTRASRAYTQVNHPNDIMNRAVLLQSNQLPRLGAVASACLAADGQLCAKHQGAYPSCYHPQWFGGFYGQLYPGEGVA